MALHRTDPTIRAANRRTNAPTHESFLAAVRTVAVDIAESLGRITAEDAARLRSTRILYGIGSHRGARGVCVFGTWTGPDGITVDSIEISAAVQESWTQLAGTDVHELAHVLAGPGAGHNRAWSDATIALGIGGPTAKGTMRPNAAGQSYSLALFQPRLRAAVSALIAQIGDGSPAFGGPTGGSAIARKCGAGIGTRGGTSRGAGSGSRFRLWACGCVIPAKVRAAAGSGFDATCNLCGQEFALTD